MSDLDTLVYDALTDDAGVAALVVARVYPAGTVPQNPTRPYIVISSTETPLYASTTSQAAIAVQCRAATLDSSRAIADAVRACLHEWTSLATTPLVTSCVLDGQTNTAEAPIDESETEVQVYEQTYEAWIST